MRALQNWPHPLLGHHIRVSPGGMGKKKADPAPSQPQHSGKWALHSVGLVGEMALTLTSHVVALRRDRYPPLPVSQKKGSREGHMNLTEKRQQNKHHGWMGGWGGGTSQGGARCRDGSVDGNRRDQV